MIRMPEDVLDLGGTKKCFSKQGSAVPSCGKEYPHTSEHFHKTGSATSRLLKNTCKECTKVYQRELYKVKATENSMLGMTARGDKSLNPSNISDAQYFFAITAISLGWEQYNKHTRRSYE